MDILRCVKTVLDFFKDFVIRVVVIIGIREFPVDMMHHGCPGCLRFKGEGFCVEAVAFQLSRIEQLDILYHPIQGCVYVRLGNAITRQKVDESNQALFLCCEGIRIFLEFRNVLLELLRF